METVERDYTPRGAHFFYVYKALAHPEFNGGYTAPFTLEERLMHLEEAKRRLGSRISWLADTMDNSFKHAFASVPNAEIIVGPDGTILRRRAWSDPEALREDLAEILGLVEEPTRVEDLDLPAAPPPTTVAKGVVPRLEVEKPMRALKIEPDLESTDHPFYVKLRAEAEMGFFTDHDGKPSSGAGQVYLGFHLDPLYEVHWNNLAKPLEWKIDVPDGVRVKPSTWRAPKVDEKADTDPREVLVGVDAERLDRPLELSVHYFACDNADTWCVPVRQKYLVRLEWDRDGGSVFSRGMMRRRGK